MMQCKIVMLIWKQSIKEGKVLFLFNTLPLIHSNWLIYSFIHFYSLFNFHFKFIHSFHLYLIHSFICLFVQAINHLFVPSFSYSCLYFFIHWMNSLILVINISGRFNWRSRGGVEATESRANAVGYTVGMRD